MATITWNEFCDSKKADWVITLLIISCSIYIWFQTLSLAEPEHNMWFGLGGVIVSIMYHVLSAFVMYVRPEGVDHPIIVDFHEWLEDGLGNKIPMRISGALLVCGVGSMITLGASSINYEEEGYIKVSGPDTIVRGISFNNPLAFDVKPVEVNNRFSVEGFALAPTADDLGSGGSIGLEGEVSIHVNETLEVIDWVWNGRFEEEVSERYVEPAISNAVAEVSLAGLITIPEIEVAAFRNMQKYDNDGNVTFQKFDIVNTYGK
jgi:hypothetical protein